MTSRARGKPCIVDADTIIREVLFFKDEIVQSGKIVTLRHEVWSTLSQKLSLSPSTINSYVLNNRFGLRNLLYGDGDKGNDKCDTYENSNENFINESLESMDSTLNLSLPTSFRLA